MLPLKRKETLRNNKHTKGFYDHQASSPEDTWTILQTKEKDKHIPEIKTKYKPYQEMKNGEKKQKSKQDRRNKNAYFNNNSKY